MKLFGIIDSGKSSTQIDRILSKMAASFRVESTEYERFCDDGGGIGRVCIAELEGNRPSARLAIGGWIGWTMATTPPPRPIEEIAGTSETEETKNKGLEKQS